MIKQVGALGTIGLLILLSGCQAMNDDLGQLNSGLSNLTSPTGSSANIFSPHTTQIKNDWNISDEEAMAWLAQNDSTWNDNGKISKTVNWYSFWSQQVHYQTALGDKAHQYCNQSSWEMKPGDNCQTYWNAYNSTKAEEVASG